MSQVRNRSRMGDKSTAAKRRFGRRRSQAREAARLRQLYADFSAF